MTLTPFPPAALDELALRIYDLAGIVRKMSTLSRENAVDDFHLHGQKAYQWLGQIEEWAHDATGRLETQLIRQRGARRALPDARTNPLPRPKRRTRKSAR